MAQIDTITIDLKTAERIYDLYRNCEAADTAYKSCQSTQFRAHLQGVYKAPNVEKAFNELQSLIETAKKE